MYQALFPTLNRHSLLLTANSRLSRALQQHYSEYQSKRGNAVWETPPIQSLNAWLNHQWQQNFSANGKLMTDIEETVVWQSIINQDKKSNLLLQIKSTATLVKQAWQTLQLWQIAVDEIEQTSDELVHFARWAHAFEKIKQQREVYSQCEMPREITQLIKSKKITLPKTVLLAGFDDFNPALRTLFNTIGRVSQVQPIHSPSINLSKKRAAFQSIDDEIEAMASWANTCLPTLKGSEKIGCIVPKLNSLRPKLMRHFTEHFAPQNFQPGEKKRQLPFNISSGEKFSQVLIIKTALNAICFNQQQSHQTLASSLLLSPYLNTCAIDQAHASMVENSLNTHRSTQHLAELIAQIRDEYFPQSKLAERWQQLCNNHPTQLQQSCSSWRVFFESLLTAIGWPGERTLDSYEYQAIKRWHELLDEFCNLDHLLPAVTHTEANHLLIELANHSLFQPQTDEAPIQVLGLLEGSGCHFKHLWLLGLNEEDWPLKAAPNPFLPLSLQRQQNMPHASAKREQEYCQNIQEKLFNSAEYAIASYSLFNEDRTQFPSPLITPLTQDAVALPEKKLTSTEEKQLENYLDEKGPAITDDELIVGGSRLLQLQASCPFKAFASLRLRAKALKTEETGVSAAERGIACHSALEFIWQSLKDQKQLLQLPGQQLQQTINRAIDKACGHYQQSLYWQVERQRLQTLLTAWLDVEKQRPAFQVSQREIKRHIQIGPLNLKIQIDRIDTLEEGKQLIIDYKTGVNNRIDTWFAQRIEQPQLPLYALYASEQSCGIAYAEVNLASLHFKGIIDTQANFSKVVPLAQARKESIDWQQQLDEWRLALEAVSQDFYRGNAKVDPMNNQACLYCEQYPLCRIGEKT